MKKHREYRECVKLLFDTNDDPDISFDASGICNYYYEYLKLEKAFLKKGKEAEKEIEQIIKFAKQNNSREYDCIIGVSGGVDSSYLLYLAKQLGLNPLAVHFDNGWNSELAVKNIESITKKLGIDLQTYVIDWEEFKDLQRSYFFAGVVDLDLPTDHAIYGSLYKLAIENNIKLILSGVNIVSESIMPHHWYYSIFDFINILDIHKRFGTVRLKNFPLVDNHLRKKIKSSGIKSFRLLNYVPYRKKEVEHLLINELGWKPYGGKHYESVYTRFFQGYILPKKFGIDKRKAHLSNLICSGQLTKEEAKQIIAVPDYTEELMQSDKDFLLKKLEFSEKFFEEYMKKPEVPHKAYLHEHSSLYDMYPPLSVFRPLGLFLKKYINIRFRPVKNL